MKRPNKFTALIGIVVSAALVLSACGGAATTAAPTAAPTEKPTEVTAVKAKIAIMGPFTGPAATIGVEQLNFARLAVADFNKQMGTQIELLEEDTQLDPAIATTVAQKLVGDPDVYAVIGPSGSQEVEASAELFEGAKLVHVSPSATRPSLTASGYKTFFRAVPNDSVQGPTDAHFIADTLKAKSVFVIDDQSSYSTSLADEVANVLGGMNVTTARESVTQDDTDFSALVTKIKAANVEVVFFPGQIASQGAQLWKQMREQGVPAILMGGDGFNSPDLIADGANEGSFVSNFAPDINGVPEAANVIEGYRAQYGDFGSFGPPTYVAAQVVLEAVTNAMKAGTLTREAVLAEVAKVKIAKTILGTPLEFDANGDVKGAQFYVFQVQNGKFTLVTQTTELVAPPKAIKIAIMGPFTGPAATIGVEQLNFARLAVALHNLAGGIPIQLIEEDTQLDPAIATTVAQKLVDDGEILAVVGPSGSQEVEASAELFEGAGLAHVSPSATRPTLTTSGYKTFFRVVPHDGVQGPTDANLILTKLNATSVYIIDDQSSYSVSLADIVEQAIKDAGVKVARESVTQDDTDFSALVTKIKAAKADVIFFPGQIASQGAQLWSQMKEQGVAATLVGGDGFNSPDLVANGANEGSYVTNFAPDIHGIPGAAEVAQAYQEQYGDFGAFGPPTYVAAQALIEAIERAAQAGNLTREGVLAEVVKTKIDKSILGSPIAFDANGDVLGAQFFTFQVQNGQFVTVTP